MVRKKHRTSPTSKTRIGLSITAQASDVLNTMAKETGLNRSTLLESILGGSIAVTGQNSEKTVKIFDLSEEENAEPKIEIIDQNIVIDHNNLNTENINNNNQDNKFQEELNSKKNLIQTLEEEIKNYKQLLIESQKISESLQVKLNEKNEVISNEEITTQVSDVAEDLEKQLLNQQKKYNSLLEDLTAKDGTIQKLTEKVKILEANLSEVQSSPQKLIDKDTLVKYLKNNTNDVNEELLQPVNNNHQKLIETLDHQIKELNQKLSDKQIKVHHLMDIIEQKDHQLDQLQTNINYQETLKSEVNNSWANLHGQINTLSQKILEQENKYHSLTQIIKEKDDKLMELQRFASFGEIQLNKWQRKFH